MKELGLVGLGGGLTYGLLLLLGNDISLTPTKEEKPKKQSKTHKKCGCGCGGHSQKDEPKQETEMPAAVQGVRQYRAI